MKDDFLDELRKTFFAESEELISEYERALLDLDRNPDDTSLLDEIFRIIHTIKGNSKAVDFPDLGKFSHFVENILTSMRTGEVSASTPGLIDLLFETKDTFQSNIEALFNNPNAALNHDRIEQSLKNCIETAHQPDSNDYSSSKIDNAVDAQSLDFGIFDAPDTPVGTTKEEVKIDNQDPNALNKIKDQQKHPENISTKQREEYVRVSVAKINELIEYSREQAGVLSLIEHAVASSSAGDEVCHSVSQLGDLTYQIQQTAISFRMVTLDSLSVKLQRTLRDAAQSTAKKVQLKVSGSCHEVEKGVLDPLVHMVRNAVDHGIEAADDRRKLGKPEVGTIKIHTYKKGGYVFVELSDDGKGLDADRIRAKANEQGLIENHDTLTNDQVYQLIFHNGLSTKDKISDVSGRGVGMDVVKNEVEKLNGKVEVRSEDGQGTKFLIRLPLPIATFNGIVVRIGKQKYILPNSEIDEVRVIKCKEISRLDDKRNVVKINDDVVTLLPFLGYDLKSLQDPHVPLLQATTEMIDKKVNYLTQQEGNERVCILQITQDHKRYGILVDEILASQKVTYKKLGTEIEELPGVAGGAVLGDGNVCLILNGADLIETRNRAV